MIVHSFKVQHTRVSVKIKLCAGDFDILGHLKSFFWIHIILIAHLIFTIQPHIQAATARAIP